MSRRFKFYKSLDFLPISWESEILSFTHKYKSRFLSSLWNVRMLPFVFKKKTGAKKKRKEKKTGKSSAYIAIFFF